MAELTVPTIDFSSLGQLPQLIQQNRQDALRRQTLASLGQGGAADADALLRSGDLSLAQLGINLRNRQEDQARQAAQDARLAANDKFSHDIQLKQLAISQRAADRADRGIAETASDRAAVVRQYGIDPSSQQGRAFILTGRLPEGDTSVTTAVEQRKAVAQANGLDPSSPGYQSYVLTGKMPREDAQPLTATDKKAILEADEAVLNNQQTADNLKTMKELSRKAYEGPTAGFRGAVAGYFGNEGGEATVNLNNLSTANALSQLKSTFGAAPTEGERKILLDIQGSANQTDAVRQEIYKRAEAAVQRRLEFNKQRAAELRGGQFYKPQGSMTRAPVAQSQGITQQQYEALPSGSVFTAPDGTQRVKP